MHICTLHWTRLLCIRNKLRLPIVLGSIIYNRAVVYKLQNFLTVLVHHENMPI